MATTPGGLPYVESTDLVSGWPAVSQSLAEELDDQLGDKAPLASPALTGTPTAPTAAAGTNTTQIATTAFVQASGGLTFVAGSALSGSSVTIDGCFTSGFTNYMIMVNAVGSANDYLNLRLRATGTSASGSNYDFQRLEVDNTTVAASRLTSQTSARVGIVDTSLSGSEILVYGPQLAAITIMSSRSTAPTGGAGIYMYGVRHTQTVAYDGLEIFPASGTFSSGNVRIYGLRDS